MRKGITPADENGISFDIFARRTRFTINNFNNDIRNYFGGKIWE